MASCFKMWYAEVRMDAATVRIAFLGPRRLLSRRNCARRYVWRVRAATQATWTSVVLSHGLPGRVRVEIRLPALSCRRGQSPAHETKVSRGRKSAHVKSDFRDDHARHRTSDRGNRHQPVNGGLKGRQGSAPVAGTPPHRAGSDGGYERAVVAALAVAGLPTVVANPRQVRDFAKATGQLAKTDDLDAEWVRPTPRPLADAVVQQLDALMTRAASCSTC